MSSIIARSTPAADRDWDGYPKQEWRELVREARRRRRSDAAGSSVPVAESVWRAGRQQPRDVRHSGSTYSRGAPAVVSNLPLALVLHNFGTDEQHEQYLEPLIPATSHRVWSHRTGAQQRHTVPGDDRQAMTDWPSTAEALQQPRGQCRGDPGVRAQSRRPAMRRRNHDLPGLHHHPRTSVPFNTGRSNHWTFNTPSDHLEVVELQTDAELIRNTIYKTAATMDDPGERQGRPCAAINSPAAPPTAQSTEDSATRGTSSPRSSTATTVAPHQRRHRKHRRISLRCHPVRLPLQQVLGSGRRPEPVPGNRHLFDLTFTRQIDDLTHKDAQRRMSKRQTLPAFLRCVRK
jgi:hypothetical protein